jgi:hypothetical protein
MHLSMLSCKALVAAVVTQLLVLASCTPRNFNKSQVEDSAASGIEYKLNSGPGFIKLNESEDAFIKSVKASGSLFGNPDFWNFYDANQTLAEERIQHWYKPINDRVTVENIAQLKSELKNHVPLLLDPGIMVRVDSFMQFYRGLANRSEKSSWDIRKEFEQFLEKDSRVVWRGMILGDGIVDVIKKKGIVGRLFLADERRQNEMLLSYLLGKQTYTSTPASSPYDDMSARLGGRAGDFSMYTSVTEYIPVTHAGAWINSYGKILRMRNDGQFYLFKIKVNPLNLVRPEGVLNRLRQKGMTYKTHVWENGVKSEWSMPFEDVGFENFIQFVPANHILEVIRYNDDPPVWWN